ncbi:putative polyhydroxybutyrate depolymerase [Roseibium sp. TrichSKD4]|nr:putative polyhydroxybutyrate depolymerase [Roseibium sp. TrichSKD4]
MKWIARTFAAMKRYIFSLISSLLVASSANAIGTKADGSCGDKDTPCVLESGRSYHVLFPDDWDGKADLPVMLHFHGWARTGSHPSWSPRTGGEARKRGVLLIAPNGEGRTWNFWRAGTSDVTFTNEVLADAKKRFPIDEDRLIVSGYSYGSAMAWRYVCESGKGVFALLAIAGSLDQTENCSTAPKQVRHVQTPLWTFLLGRAVTRPIQLPCGGSAWGVGPKPGAKTGQSLQSRLSNGSPGRIVRKGLFILIFTLVVISFHPVGSGISWMN